MSDLRLLGGGDSWEDRNDSEERVPCSYCGVAISPYELGVVAYSGGLMAHVGCEEEHSALQDQRENSSEVWNECN